mgnify:CR=1 FL=1
MRKVYLDHNATTPVHPEVAAAVQPFLGDMFGNPSSIHWAGRDVRKAVEDARAEIAAFYGCRPLEVVFTSSGTEAAMSAVRLARGARRALEGRRHDLIRPSVAIGAPDESQHLPVLGHGCAPFGPTARAVSRGSPETPPPCADS